MVKRFATRVLCWTTLMSLVVALAAVEQPALGADGPLKKASTKVKGRHERLPKYYADVVTPEQREKIVKIQDEYKPKIDDLKAQLDKLTKERDEKIQAMLTADQKKAVEEAAAKAKEKKAKSADAAPVAPPAPEAKPAK